MANFKTAHLQIATAVDVAVSATPQVGDAATSALGKAFAIRQATPSSSTAIKVGDLVVYVAKSATLPAYIYRTLSLAAATHIVAQSDNTMEYGSIPVERGDYRYFPMINGTYGTGGSTPPVAATPVKKVNLYKITDKSDVLIDASQGEMA